MLSTVEAAFESLQDSVDEAWRLIIDDQCRRFSAPDVPMEQMRIDHVTRLRPFSGVYFIWSGLLPVYVGKSKNVPARIAGHCTSNGGKIETGFETISFIKVDYEESHYLELFYIWLLRPPLNLFTESTKDGNRHVANATP